MEESKRGISKSGQASLEEGKWQLGSFSVLTEEGLERGAVIRPDSTHRLPAGSPSLTQRLTPANKKAEDTGGHLIKPPLSIPNCLCSIVCSIPTVVCTLLPGVPRKTFS